MAGQVYRFLHDPTGGTGTEASGFGSAGLATAPPRGDFAGPGAIPYGDGDGLERTAFGS